MKEKTMIFYVKQKDNMTSFECIGDDLNLELRAHFLDEMRHEMLRKGIIK